MTSNPRFDLPLDLVITCLRRPLDKPVLQKVERRAGSVTDWSRFLGWVARHRVTSLVHDALAHAPSGTAPREILDRLHGKALASAVRSMRQIGEAVRIIGVLGEAGIGALTLKGPVLSVLAFGDPVLRDSRDVDLLVAPEQFDRVEPILAASGYRRHKPAQSLSPRGQEVYRRWVHEYVYRSKSSGVVLEIKDRLHPTVSLMPIDVHDALRRAQIVKIGDHALPTLPPVELFLYLCTHGSRHAWFRLKWIADIGALKSRLPSSDLTAIGVRARELGVELSWQEALTLSGALFGDSAPGPLADAAPADPHLRRRIAASRRAISTFGPNGRPFAAFGFATRLDIGELGIRPEWRYRWDVLRRHGLARIYSLLRPVAEIGRKADSTTRPPSTA